MEDPRLGRDRGGDRGLTWEKPDDKMIDLMRSLREGLYL